MKAQKLLVSTLSLVLTAGVSAAHFPPTQAAEISPATATTQNEVSQAEIDQMAEALEELFTNGMSLSQDGTLRINEAAILAHFGDEEGKAILNNFKAISPHTGAVAPASYGQCVLNLTGFGMLFGASHQTILGYLNRQEWNKAAELMVKFLGKQAVKGGAIGLAASLAASAIWCGTPWAK